MSEWIKYRDGVDNAEDGLYAVRTAGGSTGIAYFEDNDYHLCVPAYWDWEDGDGYRKSFTIAEIKKIA